MTKKYNVVPIEDYYVVVDKDFLVTGGYRLDFYITGKPSEVRQITKIDGDKIYDGDVVYNTRDSVVGVVATIGKRIGELPLIEIPLDQNIVNLADVATNEEGYGEWDTHGADFQDGWIKGYVAATKKYSEEDIRYAYTQGALDMMVGDEDTSPKQLWIKKSREVMQSLNKPISSVELELVPDFPEIDKMTLWTLKKSETNIITPINIFYEKAL